MSREIDSIEDDWRALLWAIGSVKSLALSRKGNDFMRMQQINRISGVVLILLALVALLTVISGYFGPRQADEGAAAHIFQLSIVALLAMGLLFLATVDWKAPLRSTRILAIPASVLVLAFGALYYLEHYR
jgi:putative Ca2+/H+ antiporter (TMEM165/GDT1 family)